MKLPGNFKASLWKFSAMHNDSTVVKIAEYYSMKITLIQHLLLFPGIIYTGVLCERWISILNCGRAKLQSEPNTKTISTPSTPGGDGELWRAIGMRWCVAGISNVSRSRTMVTQMPIPTVYKSVPKSSSNQSDWTAKTPMSYRSVRPPMYLLVWQSIPTT